MHAFHILRRINAVSNPLAAFICLCYIVTVGSSLAARLDIFVGAATLAAHASFVQPGFRVRDVAFFLELFLNWSHDFDPTHNSLQRTQLGRYVEGLVQTGYARRTARSGTKVYRLTRLGLLEILTRLTDTREPLPPAQTLFRICFVQGYKPWLERLVQQEGSAFPPAMVLELRAVLDVENLLAAEIRRVERAIDGLERRIHDAERASALSINRLQAGVSLPEVVREVETRYPYELNSMKPLRELIDSIAPDQRAWELQHGNILRARTLWKPQREILREVLRQLMLMRSCVDGR
jgi:hypothetical protein